jgi:cytochrome c
VVTKLHFDPSQNYQQAGIVLYQDADNYIKFVKIYADGKKIEIAKEVNGSFTATNVNAPAGTVVYLKVSKRGTTYTGYYSTDNSTWTELSSWTGITFSSEKMGLMGLNGQTQALVLNLRRSA